MSTEQNPMQYDPDEIQRRLGLDVLEPEAAQQMLDSFYGQLDLRLQLVVSSRLTQEQLDKFSELHEAGDEEGIDALMREAVPDYETLWDQEAGNLLQEIDDNVDEMLKDL